MIRTNAGASAGGGLVPGPGLIYWVAVDDVRLDLP